MLCLESSILVFATFICKNIQLDVRAVFVKNGKKWNSPIQALTYVEKLRTIVPGANVTFAAKRTHGDGVFVQSGEVIAEAAVHVSDAVEFWGYYSGKEGYEGGRKQSLQEVFSAVELGYDDVFAVVYSSEGDMEFTVYSDVGIFWENL